MILENSQNSSTDTIIGIDTHLPLMSDESSFDYSEEMKEYYRSDSVAEEYHETFANEDSWRHTVIADRERNAINTLLSKVPHESVLDIPTGTGKLAPVFAQRDATVLACDISENMLRIAEKEFDQVDVTDARFQVCDAEKISENIDQSFDVAVCLRLLHRVPTDTKKKILRELGSVAEYVIASTGVETRFHAFRRNIRKRLLGGDERDHCYESPKDTRAIFSDGFDIVASKRVLPLLSQERVYLLRPTE